MPKIVNPDVTEDTFVEVLTRTNSPSKAMLAAQPHLTKEYAKVKAQRMLKKPDVQAKIQKKLEIMRPKALKTIDKMLTSDNEQIATANAWRVVEHLRGKPVARNLNMSVSATIEDALFE